MVRFSRYHELILCARQVRKSYSMTLHVKITFAGTGVVNESVHVQMHRTCGDKVGSCHMRVGPMSNYM
jgi:hypothetical protein